MDLGEILSQAEDIEGKVIIEAEYTTSPGFWLLYSLYRPPNAIAEPDSSIIW